MLEFLKRLFHGKEAITQPPVNPVEPHPITVLALSPDAKEKSAKSVVEGEEDKMAKAEEENSDSWDSDSGGDDFDIA